MFDAGGLLHLTAEEITEIHDLIIEQDGGPKGFPSDLSVDALVGRIQANLIYQQFESIAQVAALYAEVIARGHVFLDGNKRSAFLSMVEFLDDNGYSIPPNPVGAGDMVVMLAEGKLNYRQFAVWLAPKLLIARDEP